MKDFLESRGGALLLLYSGLIIFSFAVMLSAVYLPNHQGLYVFLSGVAGNFGGSLFTYLQIKGTGNKD
jgi:hypothetical protein